MERKIGDKFFNSEGVELEVVKGNTCEGCYYDDISVFCNSSLSEDMYCGAFGRKDLTGIIFKPTGKMSNQKPK